MPARRNSAIGTTGISCLTRASSVLRGGWIAGSSLTLNEPATSSEDIDRKSGALRCRWIICLRAGGCPHGISLERVARRAAEHNGRIVGARELLLPSTLPGSFDGCGSCPFFALAASQELAQKYPLTTLWPCRLPAESVRLSEKGSPLVAPGSVEPRSRFGYQD